MRQISRKSYQLSQNDGYSSSLMNCQFQLILAYPKRKRIYSLIVVIDIPLIEATEPGTRPPLLTRFYLLNGRQHRNIASMEVVLGPLCPE
jgi:hypothetical protein